MTIVKDVAVNLMWLRPGEVGGTETYIRRVLRSLERSDPAMDIRLFGSASAVSAVASSNATFTTAPVTNRSRAVRVALERVWLARVMEGAAQVMHHPGGTVPIDSETPTVVTIHDLQPLTNAQNFSRAKREFLSRALPEAVKRADVVATPSDWVRGDVIERLGVDPARVVTVSAYADVVDPSAHTAISPQLARILDRGPVVFYPAMTLGHKNHQFLFDAFELAQMDDPNLQLVCTGVIGKDHEEIVAYASSVSPAIHMLGRVSLEDLHGLFTRSELLVFPSLYEGFGLPILEAQQFELPVVASSATAVPEVAGDGAIILDPDDMTGWAHAMSTRLSQIERSKLVAKGRANAARYSSNSTARQQRGAYDLAAS